MYNLIMSEYRIETINGDLKPEDKKVMVDGMLSYHASKGHPRKTEQFSIIIKTSHNKLVGTIIVSFLWNGMHIDSLWIKESLRNHDWGSKLLNLAEKEGVKRGCSIAYTDTFSWQAPQFYEKQGYKLYGKLDDFPEKNTLFYYYKKLV